MTRVSLLYLLCQCTTTTELEVMARALGCSEQRWLYGACHVVLPDGQRGALRPTRDGKGYVWCASDAAE